MYFDIHIPENIKMKRKVNVSIVSVLALVAITILSMQPVSASVESGTAPSASTFPVVWERRSAASMGPKSRPIQTTSPANVIARML